MDPNAALEELRQLCAERLNPDLESDEVVLESVMESSDKAERMAELFEALDEWMSKGGFLPDAWQLTKKAGITPA